MLDSRRLGAPLAALCMWSAATASAQVMIWVGEGSGGSPPVCMDAGADCLGDADCTAADTGASCVHVAYAGTEPRAACLPEEPLFCCSIDVACPTEGGRCVRRTGSSTGACIAPDPTRYCGTTTVDSRIIACHTDETRFPVPFAAGDCDADQVANGEDSCPCEVGEVNGNGCPITDPDAGVTPDPDAGSVEPVDAGSEPDDAGQIVVENDGGPVDPRFEGGGGCACRASIPSPSGAVGLVLMALVVVRARRKLVV